MGPQERVARKAEIAARIQLARSARRFRREVRRMEEVEADAAPAPSAGLGLGALPTTVAGALALLRSSKLASPLALAGLGAVLMLIGPRRIFKLGMWALPMVLRFRAKPAATKRRWR